MIVGVTVMLSFAHLDIDPGLSIHHPVTLLVVHASCVLLPAPLSLHHAVTLFAIQRSVVEAPDAIDGESAENELIVGFW